jgi:hypothetical protein
MCGANPCLKRRQPGPPGGGGASSRGGTPDASADDRSIWLFDGYGLWRRLQLRQVLRCTQWGDVAGAARVACCDGGRW